MQILTNRMSLLLQLQCVAMLVCVVRLAPVTDITADWSLRSKMNNQYYVHDNDQQRKNVEKISTGSPSSKRITSKPLVERPRTSHTWIKGVQQSLEPTENYPSVEPLPQSLQYNLWRLMANHAQSSDQPSNSRPKPNAAVMNLFRIQPDSITYLGPILPNYLPSDVVPVNARRKRNVVPKSDGSKPFGYIVAFNDHNGPTLQNVDNENEVQRSKRKVNLVCKPIGEDQLLPFALAQLGKFHVSLHPNDTFQVTVAPEENAESIPIDMTNFTIYLEDPGTPGNGSLDDLPDDFVANWNKLQSQIALLKQNREEQNMPFGAVGGLRPDVNNRVKATRQDKTKDNARPLFNLNASGKQREPTFHTFDQSQPKMNVKNLMDMFQPPSDDNNKAKSDKNPVMDGLQGPLANRQGKVNVWGYFNHFIFPLKDQNPLLLGGQTPLEPEPEQDAVNYNHKRKAEMIHDFQDWTNASRTRPLEIVSVVNKTGNGTHLSRSSSSTASRSVTKSISTLKMNPVTVTPGYNCQGNPENCVNGVNQQPSDAEEQRLRDEWMMEMYRRQQYGPMNQFGPYNNAAMSPEMDDQRLRDEWMMEMYRRPYNPYWPPPYVDALDPSAQGQDAPKYITGPGIKPE